MANLSLSNLTDSNSWNSKITDNLNILVVVAVFELTLAVFTELLGVILLVALCCCVNASVTDNCISRKVMASMTVNDLLINLTQFPGIYLLLTNGKWILGISTLQMWQVCSTILNCVSILHVLGMAFDKYLAICHSTRYRLLPDKIG
ncbi:beta-3 adrenergic receptor, partial [Biomphalaria glabrata]